MLPAHANSAFESSPRWGSSRSDRIARSLVFPQDELSQTRCSLCSICTTHSASVRCGASSRHPRRLRRTKLRPIRGPVSSSLSSGTSSVPSRRRPLGAGGIAVFLAEDIRLGPLALRAARQRGGSPSRARGLCASRQLACSRIEQSPVDDVPEMMRACFSSGYVDVDGQRDDRRGRDARGRHFACRAVAAAIGSRHRASPLRPQARNIQVASDGIAKVLDFGWRG